MTPPTDSLAHRTLVVSGCVGLVVVLGLVAWKALPALVLLFAAVLVALLLGGLAAGIARRTPLGYKGSLAIGSLVLVGLIAGAAWFVGSGLTRQLAGVGEALPAGLERAEALVRGAAARVGLDTGSVPPLTEAAPEPAAAARRALGVVKSAASGLGSVLLTVLLGLFLAASPETYRKGLLHLVPLHRRARAAEVLAAVAHAVREWLVARLIIMVLTFALTWAGLALLGVPFAGGLAVLSGLVTFVPYVGPYVSGALAVLVSLLSGPQTALTVALFYVGLESVFSWTAEPLVESRLTSAPPGLLLASQLVMGALLGVAGFVLASPLVVALTVAVQMLYVQDTLGDDTVTVLGADD